MTLVERIDAEAFELVVDCLEKQSTDPGIQRFFVGLRCRLTPEQRSRMEITLRDAVERSGALPAARMLVRRRMLERKRATQMLRNADKCPGHTFSPPDKGGYSVCGSCGWRIFSRRP